MKSAEKDVCSVGLWGAAAVVASGSSILERFADVLSPSPVAFELKAPVLLTDDNGDYLLKTRRVLASCSTIAQVLVARGTTVFSGVTEGFMQAVTLTGGVQRSRRPYGLCCNA